MLHVGSHRAHMRNAAPSWLLMSALMVSMASSSRAETFPLAGKPATWESWGDQPQKTSVTPPSEGQELETPNHRKQRLGQVIEASYPAPDYGVAEETPNQRRHRMSLTASIAQAR